MKILELKLKKDVLIVQPDERGNINSWIALHSKKWNFICLGSELTEEMASELVDFWQNMANDGFIFENYKDNIPKKLTAKKSFISAVESKEKFWLENNLPPYIPVIDKKADENYIKKYFEAEEKTFRNPLIFVKK